MVIRRPYIPIPIDATPIARRYGGSLEVGAVVTMRPKTRIATPMIASEIHPVLNRMLARCVIGPDPAFPGVLPY
jgi:hypothetical protein